MTATGLARSKPMPAAAVRPHHHSRRHRLDRRQHHRSDQARARALSRGGGHRAAQRRGAGARSRATSARSLPWSPILRPTAISRTRWPAPASKPRPARRRCSKRRTTSGRLGDGGDQRRDRPEADTGGHRARRNRRARQQGMPGLRRQPVHAAGGEQRAPPCCRSIPSTTRCSRRSAPARARTSSASSSPRRAARSAPGRSIRSRRRRRSRRCAIPTGRWGRASPSIPPP